MFSGVNGCLLSLSRDGVDVNVIVRVVGTVVSGGYSGSGVTSGT